MADLQTRTDHSSKAADLDSRGSDSNPYDDAVVAEIYDSLHANGSGRVVDFFVEAAIEAGSPVLELCCGSGSVLIPTARAGITIVGIDSSLQMLALCRRRLSAEPETVRSRVPAVLHGDMRNFDIDGAFTLVTIPTRPFQHLLTTEDQLACLECIRRHLVAEGRLVFDVFNPSLEALANGPFDEESDVVDAFTMPDGRRVLRTYRKGRPDRFAQVARHEVTYEITHPDGRVQRITHRFPLRYFFKFEVEHLLARAGFEVEHVYADHYKSPYGSREPGQLILVARKLR
jgi:SAM-dependent methyltransferase